MSEPTTVTVTRGRLPSVEVSAEAVDYAMSRLDEGASVKVVGTELVELGYGDDKLYILSAAKWPERRIAR